MIIPERFEFMRQQWTIRSAMAREMPDDMGQCRPVDLEIVIDSTLPEDLQRQVLWHELIHTIEQTFQLDMPDRTVDLIALGIIELIETNPELAMTLIGDR